MNINIVVSDKMFIVLVIVILSVVVGIYLIKVD